MIIGFTGTRFGLSPAQRAALREVVLSPPCYYAERHLNGGCHGADREMFDMLMGHPGFIEVLPGSPEQLIWAEHQRAFPGLMGRYLIHPVEPYLARDLKIATRCDRLIACPYGPEKVRSGTWVTVRYVRKAGKPITLILPDGRIEDEPVTITYGGLLL